MKKAPSLLLAFAATVLLNYSNLNAQDSNTDGHNLTVVIPEVALLDIEINGPVTLSPAAPEEAGDPIDFTSVDDNSLWLNYSSIVGSSSEPSRSVSANLSGNLPPGANLIVEASAASSDGAGVKGSSVGSVTLALPATDYTVITNIGSCYTGDGPNKGHNLTYSLSENTANYGDLDFDADYTVTITYTLSDN